MPIFAAVCQKIAARRHGSKLGPAAGSLRPGCKTTLGIGDIGQRLIMTESRLGDGSLLSRSGSGRGNRLAEGWVPDGT
jgi:hypothetical protein